MNSKSKFFYKHHKRFSKHCTILILVLIVLACSQYYIVPVYGGCRDQERVECEQICIFNSTTNKHNCNLRAVVILPRNTTLEASLPKVS